MCDDHLHGQDWYVLGESEWLLLHEAQLTYCIRDPFAAGTLTANVMTARALFIATKNYLLTNPDVKLADCVNSSEGGAPKAVVDLLCRLISIDTMDETVLYFDSIGGLESSNGNPTECALLILVHELGFDYKKIRDTTRGRSEQGALAEHLSEGKQYDFTSARKMMSWAVPLDGGGYRLY